MNNDLGNELIQIMQEFLSVILECVADRIENGETVENALRHTADNIRESTDHKEGGNHD